MKRKNIVELIASASALALLLNKDKVAAALQLLVRLVQMSEARTVLDALLVGTSHQAAATYTLSGEQARALAALASALKVADQVVRQK